MKPLFFIIFVISALMVSAQKDQDPDTLVWNNRRYAVTVDRDVPSILMVYFQRVGKESPFTFWSSNLSRGHVATFEILNNDLYLARIEAKRYKTNTGNLWSESGIDTVVTPSYFRVTPIEAPLDIDEEIVVADWFTGVLELTLIPSDKKDLKSDEAKGHRYLHIVNGHLKNNLFVPDADLARLQKDATDVSLRNIADLFALRERYLNFYLRCAMDREPVLFNGHSGLFEHATNSLTLVMELFDNDPLRCPSGWENTTESGAPFGSWIIRNDSLFLAEVSTHSGVETYSFDSRQQSLPFYLADSVVDGVPYNHRRLNDLNAYFADWIDGNYIIHYGSWENSSLGLPTYLVSKTHKIRIKDGLVLSSSFSPSSFEDDERSIAEETFYICNDNAVWSVDDKLLAETVGEFKHPKINPSYTGDKTALRNWFLNNPLTDERVKDRLFRVRIAFMVNCDGEAGRWQVMNKGKGELFEFANMVLDLVKTMPQKWIPAKDKKGNPVDCWQILEFTVNNGVLTNGIYK